jgi:hypothetical protein
LALPESALDRGLFDVADGDDVDPLFGVRGDRLARGRRNVGVVGDALAEAGRERTRAAPRR